jgi:N-acetylglutamate synthase-like GNAT family acetyltransferase
VRFGAFAIGEQAAELRADAVRVSRITAPADGLLPRVAVAMDGLGSGQGDQLVRPVLYTAAGVLLATAPTLTVPDGSPAE